MVIDFHAIAQIESNSGRDMAAYSLNRDDVGLYQVTHVVLEEYNQYHSHGYTKADLLDNNINAIVAQWYMEVRIPRLLRHFGLRVTVDNCLICWNGGIKAAIKHHLTGITKRYLREYHKIDG